MSTIKIDVTDRPVLDALARLHAAAVKPEPILRAIGEDLLVMSKEAFAASRSPDGTPWAPNSQATYEALARRRGSNFRKGDGRLSAKGAARLMAKKPLIGETGALSAGVRYNVASGVLEFGNIMEYAAMQHFGGTKARFPNLWGDIPARPHLPITAGGDLMAPAREAILRNVREGMEGAWDAG